MRTQLTSSSWVEAAATLAASILMTVAGFTALRDLPATPSDNVATPAPARAPGVADADARNVDAIAMPHGDVARG
jgi:hypothetical protein